MFGSTIPLQYLSDAQTEGFKPSSSSPEISPKSPQTLPTSSIKQNTKPRTPWFEIFRIQEIPVLPVDRKVAS